MFVSTVQSPGFNSQHCQKERGCVWWYGPLSLLCLSFLIIYSFWEFCTYIQWNNDPIHPSFLLVQLSLGHIMSPPNFMASSFVFQPTQSNYHCPYVHGYGTIPTPSPKESNFHVPKSYQVLLISQSGVGPWAFLPIPHLCQNFGWLVLVWVLYRQLWLMLALKYGKHVVSWSSNTQHSSPSSSSPSSKMFLVLCRRQETDEDVSFRVKHTPSLILSILRS